VAIGALGAPATITLRNAGNLPATGLSVAWSNSSSAFRYTNGCATSLAPGASCTLTVQFVPTADVSLTTVLTVDRNASTGPLTARVTARGAMPAGWLFGSSFEDGTVP
jgi:Abnormal spindle-like microcephaly-assoc'd, ASPM-SPD-2-Hydin